MFGKMFGKKATAARAEFKKLENRDLMEAIIGGSLLIVFADGEAEDSELKKLNGLVRSNKSLEHFGVELTDTINRFTQRLQSGYRVARNDILREIEQCKGNRQESEDILLNMIEIAFADGECEPQEQKELETVSERLGLRLSDYV